MKETLERGECDGWEWHLIVCWELGSECISNPKSMRLNLHSIFCMESCSLHFKGSQKMPAEEVPTDNRRGCNSKLCLHLNHRVDDVFAFVTLQRIGIKLQPAFKDSNLNCAFKDNNLNCAF